MRTAIQSPPQFGQYCQESASYQEWRILEIAREKSTIQGRKLYILNLLLTEKDNVIIKMFLLF